MLSNKKMIKDWLYFIDENKSPDLGVGSETVDYNHNLGNEDNDLESLKQKIIDVTGNVSGADTLIKSLRMPENENYAQSLIELSGDEELFQFLLTLNSKY